MHSLHQSSVSRSPLLPDEKADAASRCYSNKEDIVFPCGRLNHNVTLNLLLCVLYGISESLWGDTVIAAYLKRLGHNRNSPVGNVEAASGLAALLSALPVGFLADKIGRSKVIAAGGMMLLTTAIIHACLLQWIGVDDDAPTKTGAFWLLGAVMALWGVGGGIVDGPAQALYADSTPAGSRSRYYMYLFACYSLSSCVGPLVSILLFQTIGDEWDLCHLRLVLYVGLGLEALNAIIMMFFDDSKALDEMEQDDDDEEDSVSPSCEEADEEQTLHQTALNDDGEEGAGSAIDAATLEQSNRLKQRRKWIPYIGFVSDLIQAIGSGMTVKFFPLFFKDEVGMSPSQVQIVYVIVPIALVGCSGLGSVLASTGFGRVQSSLLLMILGVSGLFAMVFCKSYLDVHPFVLVPIYVLRTALMNAPEPLQESVIMDFVPKNERATWNSLDSVSSFGWCGSAALGGWLTDLYDYTYTFLITAILQSVGILVYALMLPLVPRKEEDLAKEKKTGEAGQNRKTVRNGESGLLTAASTAASSGSLQEPLLDGSR